MDTLNYRTDSTPVPVRTFSSLATVSQLLSLPFSSLLIFQTVPEFQYIFGTILSENIQNNK
jgi:hypothetical protein